MFEMQKPKLTPEQLATMAEWGPTHRLAAGLEAEVQAHDGDRAETLTPPDDVAAGLDRLAASIPDASTAATDDWRNAWRAPSQYP